MAQVAVRLEQWLWYAFLATAGWQSRAVLWQADAVFWEWRSASLWHADLLLLALWAIAAMRGWRPHVRGGDVLAGLLLAAAVLSLGNADSLAVGSYALLRLAQGVLLYLYLRQWAWRTFDLPVSAAAFVVGALSQAVLGLAQFALRHDLGLRLFGEPVLRTGMRGVAVFYGAAHEKVLRAYGTLPHPNVLAVFLMTASWALAWLYARHGSHGNRERAVWVGSGVLLTWGLCATFSRTMLAAWVAASTAVAACAAVPRISARWPNIAVVRRRLAHAAAVAAASGALFLLVFWPAVRARLTVQPSDESLRLRVRYARDALVTGGDSRLDVNWTGVGIGNFTSWLQRYDPSLPRFLQQPAHNIYLLVYAELGAVGLAAWLAFVVHVVRRAWRAHAAQPLVRAGTLAMLGAFLAIGVFDHFSWTLMQGQLLFWSVLAVAAGPDERYH